MLLRWKNLGRAVAQVLGLGVVLGWGTHAQAQCIPDASINAPSNVDSFSNFSLAVTAQNCGCNIERSTDGGQNWGFIGGTSGGTHVQQSTGCGTTALYRLTCNSSCPGGGSFTRGPVAVTWPTFVPDITLNAPSLEPFQTYQLTANLNNPKPNRASIGVNVEISEDGGLNWGFVGGATIGGTPIVISNLTTNGCPTTRLHRLRYFDCNQAFVSPTLTRSWVRYVPDITLDAPTLGPWQSYQVRAVLNNPAPNRPTVGVNIEISEDGGQSWGFVGGATITGAQAVISNLTTNGCATTRLHRVRYTDCSTSLFSPVLSRSWALYVPDITLDATTLGPWQSYSVRAVLNNPAPNRSAVGVNVEISEDGGQNWGFVGGATIAGTQAIISNLSTNGCATTRLHRVRYTDCSQSLFSPVLPRSWVRYDPVLDMQVSPPGVLLPNTNFSILARLTNPAPNRSSVGYNIEISDDNGVTWGFIGGATSNATLAAISTGTTPSCGRTRLYRARYNDCSFTQTIGNTSVTSSSVLAAASIEAPPMINPPATYTVTALISGVPGNQGTIEYSDNFGQTWINIGTVVGGVGSFGVNASSCSRLRIHRLRYTDFCNVQNAEFAYSCCTQSPPAIVASVSPASQQLICGNDFSFSVDAGSDYPTSVMSFQWRRNGVPLADGPTGSGSTVVGASTPSLMIRGAGKGDAGGYTCFVQTVCASGDSSPGTLDSCVADVDDGSFTGRCDGGVTVDDLIFYLSLFENGDSRADVDDGSASGTPDGGVTIDDLLYYVARFEGGC